MRKAEKSPLFAGVFVAGCVDGVFGSLMSTPILNPPETGILGVGRVVEKPGVFEGQVCVRKMMTLSLTFNHMVTDGGPAMSFLRTLADMLEQPVRMLG